MISFFKKYWRYILIVMSIVFIFAGSYLYIENNSNIKTEREKKLSLIKEDVKEENKEESLFVDVKGAVITPGVYQLDEGKRVIDAINLAGGLTDDATTFNLNLSKKLTDEMYIIVYTKSEIESYKKINETEKIECVSTECICPNNENNACINNSTLNNNTLNNKTKNALDSNNKISINNATKEELMSLSGIGEVKADAIISYRQENGNFNSVEDIKNVSGISDNIFKKIKDNITL